MVETDPDTGAKSPSSTCLTPSKGRRGSRDAARLVRLASGPAPIGEKLLHDLGAAVIGRDLGHNTWQLKGWHRPRVVPPLAPLTAMTLALGIFREPQRVRIGTRWITNQDGTVATNCVPALLPPATAIRWLRAAFFRLLNEIVEADEPMPGIEVLDPYALRNVVVKWETAKRAHVTAAGDESPATWEEERLGFVPPLPADRLLVQAEALDAFFTRAGGAADTARLYLAGLGAKKIARHLAVSDRTAGRLLHAMRRAAVEPATATPPSRSFRGDSVNGSRVRAAPHRALLRPMTRDEVDDWRAGYPASRYRRRELSPARDAYDRAAAREAA